MKKLGFLVVLLGIGANLHAQNNPISFPSDKRIKQVAFKENNVIPIAGKTFTTTHIQFGENEKVLDIEGGDTAAWMVTYHPELANTVFVKPTIFGSTSNLTVITNRHTYYFHLASNQKLEQNSKGQIYALKFTYPETHKVLSRSAVKTTLESPKAVNTAYRFSGSPQLVPLHVFDDGRFTYFELSHQGAVPAIFAVDDKNGKESTVNVRRQGKYLVVQRLAPQFTLRSGVQVTSVFNTREINRIALNKRPA